MKTRISLLLAIILIVSCKKEELPIDKGQVLTFKSEIVKYNSVKSANDSWTMNDEIGVFMKEKGKTLSTTTIIQSSDNKRYITNGDGIFTPKTNLDQILFNSGSSFDIIAYYPAKEVSGFLYPIDLTNQENQSALDLMYSNNLSNVSSNNLSLKFNHQLVKLQFNISSKDAAFNVNQELIVKLKSFVTEGSFSLIDGSLTPNNSSISDIVVKTTANGNTADCDVTILPGIINQGIISISIAGKTFEYKLPSNINYIKGNTYIYNIVLETGIKAVENWIEIPAKSTIPNTIIIKHELPDKPGIRNFTMLYDTVYKLSYWVAYPLHSSYIGTSGRNDAWQYDPSIDTLKQPAILLKSYAAASTDRGHQLPSADRTYSVAGNESTFYFTNMTAQNSDLNRETWANLEKRVRIWMKKCDTLYVVTGAMVTTNTDKKVTFVNDNYKKPIARPKYYYKALAMRINNQYYTIGFKINNESKFDDFNNYRMTLKDLEKETGFTFFPNIPAASKETIDAAKWN